MKLGQLTKFNMRNIFLEKSYTKFGGEAIPRPFFKKIKIEHISGLMTFCMTFEKKYFSCLWINDFLHDF